MTTVIYDRFQSNIGRVDSLLKIYNTLKDVDISADIRSTDILRSAIVFLHGTQEDYIRSMLIEWLPKRASKDALKDILLLNKEGRSQKYEFGDLFDYKEMTVNDLIKESIEYSLQRQTFNSYYEIQKWVKKIGISLDKVNSDDKKSIELLTQRRHRIVHEVDLDKASRENNSTKRNTASINLQTVERWKSAIISLVTDLDQQIESWSISENNNELAMSIESE